MVSFESIPAGIRTPGQFVEISNARASSGGAQHVALLIGQILAAGTVSESVPTLVPSKELGETYFGAGSHLAEMCRAFKEANPSTELWAIGLNDADGATVHTRLLTVIGTASAAGTICLYIGGRRVALTVASGDGQEDIASALDAAIKAHKDYARMPFTSSVDTNVVTLTAKNKGSVANGIDVRVNYLQGESLPAGVSVVIASGVLGAGDPDITDALDVIGDVQYHTIASSLADQTNVTALTDFLLGKWGPLEQQAGQAFIAASGNLSALQSQGALYNTQFLTIWETGGLTAGSPTPTYVAAAAVAAIDAFHTVLDPIRPRQTLRVPGVMPPAQGDRFSREERDTLLNSGIATHIVDAGGNVLIERLITTYRTSPAGVPDTSYLDVETMRGLDYLRTDWRNYIQGKYPRHKLANDGTLYAPGQAVVTPATIRAEAIARSSLWEQMALIENREQFIESLVVQRNATDPNRLDYVLVPDLANGFRVGAGQIQFLP